MRKVFFEFLAKSLRAARSTQASQQNYGHTFSRSYSSAFNPQIETIYGNIIKSVQWQNDIAKIIKELNIIFAAFKHTDQPISFAQDRINKSNFSLEVKNYLYELSKFERRQLLNLADLNKLKSDLDQTHEINIAGDFSDEDENLTSKERALRDYKIYVAHYPEKPMDFDLFKLIYLPFSFHNSIRDKNSFIEKINFDEEGIMYVLAIFNQNDEKNKTSKVYEINDFADQMLVLDIICGIKSPAQACNEGKNEQTQIFGLAAIGHDQKQSNELKRVIDKNAENKIIKHLKERSTPASQAEFAVSVQLNEAKKEEAKLSSLQ